MSDYLKGLCSRKRIKLVYTDNDYTVLSARVSNDTPEIRVFSQFKGCPDKVADAIFGYYTKRDSSFLKIIKDFMDGDLYFFGYEIEPPDEMFMEKINGKSAVDKYQPYQKTERRSDYIEMDILSITKKDFYGNSVSINPKKTLKTQNDSVSELDIIIDG